MKKALFLTALLTAVPLTAANAGEGSVTAAYGTPVIDGVMEEMWNNASVCGIDIFTTERHGADGVFRTMWDEENLYVFAEVKDSVVSAAANAAHEQDSIEIFLDENMGKTEYYEYDDSQYRISCENKHSYSTGAVKDFRSECKITQDGYVIEAAIPFKTIMGGVNRTIGFEIQINDDGDGNGVRTSIAKFCDSTDLSYCNTSLYGELTMGAPKYTFSDLEKSEQADIVAYMAENGIIDGYDDGSFSPKGNVKREEFLKMLISIFRIDEIEKDSGFEDVVSGMWYERAVNTAAAVGIINGISEKKFGIGEPITNDETAKMLCRAMRCLGVETDKSEIEYLEEIGINTGNKAEYTLRGDAAEMLYKAYLYTSEFIDNKNREEEKMQNYGKELINAAGVKEIGKNNPIYTQRFGADPYALVYNGRVYIYMSGDELMYDDNNELKDNDYSNINTISVISSADLVNWTDHGQIDVGGRTNADGAAKWALNSWAPAAAHKTIDGKEKFFLYFADNASGIGVLEADSPVGPFTDPIGDALIKPGVTPGTDGVVWYFDPAVMVDDDGQAYLYFGGGIPNVNGVEETDHPNTVRVIKLGEDMTSVVGEAVTIDAPAVFEDSGIHKYNGRYYYSYCTNFGGSHEDGKYPYGTIAYMTSDSPMGPFEYQGAILNNMYEFFNIGGNNHHAVFEFKNKWYITYHAQTVSQYMGTDKGYRSTHINELQYNPDNSIIPIKADFEGADAADEFNPYERVNAATVAWHSGISTRPNTENGGMQLTAIDDGDWVALGNVDFEDGAVGFTVNAVSENGGAVEIRLDSADGELIGTAEIGGDGKYTDYGCEVKSVSGIHKLFLVFKGSGSDIFEIASWQFKK